MRYTNIQVRLKRFVVICEINFVLHNIMKSFCYRLQEVERSSKELDTRAAIDRETLEILQSNLVTEKWNNQQLCTILEKLGLSDNILLTLPLETILERYE